MTDSGLSRRADGRASGNPSAQSPVAGHGTCCLQDASSRGAARPAESRAAFIKPDPIFVGVNPFANSNATSRPGACASADLGMGDPVRMNSFGAGPRLDLGQIFITFSNPPKSPRKKAPRRASSSQPPSVGLELDAIAH